MSEDFWSQFWPQFWGGVASALFLGILTLVFTYIARLQIALFFKRTFESMKSKVAMEEERIKEMYSSRK